MRCRPWQALSRVRREDILIFGIDTEVTDLQSEEPLVQSSGLEQCTMRSALDHFPVMQHENVIGAKHGAQTVRDRDRRSTTSP